VIEILHYVHAYKAKSLLCNDLNDFSVEASFLTYRPCPTVGTLRSRSQLMPHPWASRVQVTALTCYNAARKSDCCGNSRPTRSTKNTITELLDQSLPIEIATRIKSQAKNCFDNACKAALAIEGAL
jgi:hypothetical protein